MKGLKMESSAIAVSRREKVAKYIGEGYKYSESHHDGAFGEQTAVHDNRAVVAIGAAVAEAIMHLADVIEANK